MSTLQRWEYRFETLGSAFSRPKDEQIEDLLNEWGEDGWELVSFSVESSKLLFLARRPLTQTARRQRTMPGY